MDRPVGWSHLPSHCTLGFAVLVITFLHIFSHNSFAAEAVYMHRPFAIAALAGVERFEEDLQRLSVESGHSELLDKFHELQSKIAQFGGEIDKSRAIGGAVFLHREELKLPAVVLMLPVNDGVSLVEKLQKKLPAIQKVTDGEWQVQLPRIQIHILHRDDYLIVTQEHEVLSLMTSDRLSDLNSVTRANDIFAQVDFAGLSDSVRRQVLQDVGKDLDKESARKPEETDEEFRLRSELIGLIRAAILLVVHDTDTISAGIQLTDEIQVHLEWSTLENSTLATLLNKISLTAQNINLPPTVNVPLQIQFGFQLPRAIQHFALEFFNTARGQIRKEIGPKLAEKDRGPVSGAFDAIERTIKRGIVDGIISFQEADQNEMILVAGLNVVADELLATSLETILPYARDSDDITEVEMNSLTTESLTLHRLQGREQRAEDRRLYGESAALYVGTSPEAFWIANGNKQTPKLIESFAQLPEEDFRQLVSIKFSLDPWLRLAEKHERDLKKIQIVRRAIRDAQHDQITFELKNNPDGLQATLKAEKGYFKLFGVALEEDRKK